MILVRLFGTPSVRVGERTTTSFRSSRIPALFALLASNTGPVSRETAAAALWPDSSEGDARHNLRQTLLYIKQLLGSEAVSATRQSISLGTATKVDVGVILRVQDSLLSPDESLAAASDAVAAHQGALLPGFDDEWLEPIRYQCSHAYVAALVRLSDSLVQSNPARALEYADAAIQVEPFLENLRARKIRILMAMGEQASAHRELASFREFLDQELGIEPSRVALEAIVSDNAPSRSSLDSKVASSEQPISVLLASSRPSRGLQLAIDMTPYWIACGAIEVGIQTLRHSLDALRGRVPKDLEHRGMIQLTVLLTNRAQYFEAKQLLDQVLAATENPHVRLLAQLETMRLLIFLYQGHRVESLRTSVLELAHRIGTEEEIMDTYRWIAGLEVQAGDLGTARHYAERCAELAKKIGDWQAFATAISLVAEVHAKVGLAGEAKSAVQMGLRELQDKSGRYAVFTRGRFSRILEELGEVAIAEKGYRKTIEDSRKGGDQHGLAVSLTYLGDLLHQLGKEDEALIRHREALQIRQEMGEPLGEATSLRGIGRALLGLGRLEEAREALRESSRLYLLCEAVPGHASVLVDLAHVAERSKRHDLARRLAIRARDLLIGMPASARMTIGPMGNKVIDDVESLIRSLS
ncbi:MAG: tetratricopeptide repeat protein [Armatimonadetes bacterium]|nr:tetratricopeptide repeat protein [Armatimonadota bacterium]